MPAEETIVSSVPELGLQECCKPLCECEELDTGPLQKQQMFLTAESSPPQPLGVCILIRLSLDGFQPL